MPFISEDIRYQLETVFFKRIDQEGSDVLKKLEMFGAQSLTQSERFSWAIFIVALMQRHPVRVEHLARSTEQHASAFLDESREDYLRGRPAGDTKPFEVFKAEALAGEQIAQQKKVAIQSGILIPRTITWIGNATMAIATFKDNHTLLTSDRPVMMTNGLGRPFGHIALPIGPRRLFIAAESADTISGILTQPRIVGVLNDRVVRQAEEFVFGSDPLHFRFIERRLRSRQRQRPAGRAKKKRMKLSKGEE